MCGVEVECEDCGGRGVSRIQDTLNRSLHSVKGNRAFADLRYWEKDSICPSTLIFPATKKLTRDIYLHIPTEVL